MGKGVERHIAVGNLQREDKEFSNMLLKKFAEIRAVFIAENKLTDDNIISVKKDAIYTIGRCKKTRFDLIAFTIYLKSFATPNQAPFLLSVIMEL